MCSRLVDNHQIKLTVGQETKKEENHQRKKTTARMREQ